MESKHVPNISSESCLRLTCCFALFFPQFFTSYSIPSGVHPWEGNYKINVLSQTLYSLSFVFGRLSTKSSRKRLPWFSVFSHLPVPAKSSAETRSYPCANSNAFYGGDQICQGTCQARQNVRCQGCRAERSALKPTR